MSDQDRPNGQKHPPFTMLPHAYFEALCASKVHPSTKDLVLYVLRHTRGFLNQPTITLSANEFINGRRKKNGERYDAGTSIKSRNGVANAIAEAQAAGLLEVFDVSGPRDEKTFRIPEHFFATCSKNEQDSGNDHQEDTNSVAPAQNLSIPRSKNEHIPAQKLHMSSAKTEQVPSSQPSPQEAPAQPKDTSLETEKETRRDTYAPSALSEKEQAERIGLQNRLSSLKKEQEEQEALLYSQPGNGAAQRRLREIHENMLNLQAQLGRDDTAQEQFEDIPPTAELEEATREYNELQQEIAGWQQELETITEELQGDLDSFTRTHHRIRKRVLERDKLPPALERKAALALFLNISESA
jgi:hypothetical protein